MISRRATDRLSRYWAAAAGAAQLGEAGLVDEYQFAVIPVALGGGRTVFTRSCKLRLLDHRSFSCGNIVVTYAT